MKTNKFFSVILALIILLGTLTISVAAEQKIEVLLNGIRLSFDVPPQIIGNRTMVPMRVIFEALGSEVDWDGDTRTITSMKDGIIIVMQIDNAVMSVDGEDILLDVPPQIVDDRTLVPVRAVAEGLSASVDWDAGTRTVTITTGVKSGESSSAAKILSQIPYYGDRSKCRMTAEQALAYAEYIRANACSYTGWDEGSSSFIQIPADFYLPVLIDVAGDGIPFLVILATTHESYYAPDFSYFCAIRKILWADGALQKDVLADSLSTVHYLGEQLLLTDGGEEGYYWGQVFRVSNGTLHSITSFETDRSGDGKIDDKPSNSTEVELYINNITAGRYDIIRTWYSATGVYSVIEDESIIKTIPNKLFTKTQTANLFEAYAETVGK